MPLGLCYIRVAPAFRTYLEDRALCYLPLMRPSLLPSRASLGKPRQSRALPLSRQPGSPLPGWLWSCRATTSKRCFPRRPATVRGARPADGAGSRRSLKFHPVRGRRQQGRHVGPHRRRARDRPEKIAGVKLARNAGHQKALLAGIDAAVPLADCVVTIDADLQDDVDAMVEFVRKYREGYEIVLGVRRERALDTRFKRGSALGFYRVLRAMGVDVVYNHAELPFDEPASAGPVAAFWRGSPVSSRHSATPRLSDHHVYYDRQARFAGESKYPLKKMLGFAVDGVTSFSVTPLRWIGLSGLLVCLLSILGAIAAAVAWDRGWRFPVDVHPGVALVPRRPAVGRARRHRRVPGQDITRRPSVGPATSWRPSSAGNGGVISRARWNLRGRLRWSPRWKPGEERTRNLKTTAIVFAANKSLVILVSPSLLGIRGAAGLPRGHPLCPDRQLPLFRRRPLRGNRLRRATPTSSPRPSSPATPCLSGRVVGTAHFRPSRGRADLERRLLPAPSTSS